MITNNLHFFNDHVFIYFPCQQKSFEFELPVDKLYQFLYITYIQQQTCGVKLVRGYYIFRDQNVDYLENKTFETSKDWFAARNIRNMAIAKISRTRIKVGLYRIRFFRSCLYYNFKIALAMPLIVFNLQFFVCVDVGF